MYAFFFVFIIETVILEVQLLISHCFYNRKGDFGVQILICHCIYNRKGDFGGPNINFSLFL